MKGLRSLDGVSDIEPIPTSVRSYKCQYEVSRKEKYSDDEHNPAICMH